MWLTIIVGLLSAFFIFASSIKIFAWQQMIFTKQLAMFESYGLNRNIMRLVGCVEAFGAVAIWFLSSAIGAVGALALFCTSLGAIACHLIFDSWKDAIPAMITLTLSAVLVWATRAPLLALFGVADIF